MQSSEGICLWAIKKQLEYLSKRTCFILDFQKIVYFWSFSSHFRSRIFFCCRALPFFRLVCLWGRRLTAFVRSRCNNIPPSPPITTIEIGTETKNTQRQTKSRFNNIPPSPPDHNYWNRYRDEIQTRTKNRQRQTQNKRGHTVNCHDILRSRSSQSQLLK